MRRLILTAALLVVLAAPAWADEPNFLSLESLFPNPELPVLSNFSLRPIGRMDSLIRMSGTAEGVDFNITILGYSLVEDAGQNRVDATEIDVTDEPARLFALHHELDQVTILHDRDADLQ